MNTRSSTWSVVLAFGDSRRCSPPPGLTRAAFYEAACLDTLQATLDAVEPTHLTVVTDIDSVRSLARAAGATVSAPGRDMTSDVSAAMARWAEVAPTRSGIALVGPLPYASADTLLAALRACAATESAVIVADDGGSVALSHHDPARLSPRFGGASAARHTRGAVAVGQHITGLERRTDAAGTFPGRHLVELLERESEDQGDRASAPGTSTEEMR